tara:strand:- start:42 stop:497 length:456 start_codon:yes stop_codon:yes gene_type:complete
MANQYPKISQQNRTEAKKRGDKTYQSGTPCKKCGTYDKYVSTYGCVKCVRETGIKRLNDPELMAPYRTKEKQNNKMNRYRASKHSQTPVLTKEENECILTLYRECAKLTETTGVLHHVDHIYPISKGGLHHPDNLQILTARENIRKRDKTE